MLVVEDDDLLRELIATALEVRGYAVQTASNVVDAKKLFHATDPDGLVLDVDLGPGPNGFDFAQTAIEKPFWLIGFVGDDVIFNLADLLEQC